MPVPASTSQPSLYAPREHVFPKSVSGFYRRLKWWIMGVTLAIYYLTPWIRWDRGPHLPDQAVLVDLANRRFFFFWIEIWPDEFYYVAGLLIMAGLGLFLFTSVLGRVWCGYACPQTVWVDLYQHVERWIDGDRNAQFRLLKSPWTREKIARSAAKWSIWLLIAVATGGAWIFYFADAPTLFVDLFTGQAHPVAYGTVAVLTATTFVLGGFMREQVCIYMCPWPRIQAAMLDENSLTVTYKDWRGEPRGKHRKAAEAGEPRRLHRLQRLRRRLPDRRRHPQRPADRLHHLRALHRRLRRHHGEGRQAARADRLLQPGRREARARRPAARCRPGGAPSGRGRSSTPRSGRRVGVAMLVALFMRESVDVTRAARPQSGLRHAVGRLDPQRL